MSAEQILSLIPNWLLPSPALAVAGVLWKGDSLISKDARSILGKALVQFDAGFVLRRVQDMVPLLIAAIYGEFHFSAKCVARVLLISEVVCIILFFITEYIIHGASVLQTIALLTYSPLILAFYLASITLIGFTSDYFSVLKTRYLIDKLGEMPNLFKIVVVMIIDVVLSVFIFAVVFILMVLELPSVLNPMYFVAVNLTQMGDMFFGPALPLTIAMAASCAATSTWILFFAAALLLLRVTLLVRPAFKFLFWLLPADEYPIRSVGIAAGVSLGIAISAAKAASILAPKLNSFFLGV
jgi:hypothetical protein